MVWTEPTTVNSLEWNIKDYVVDIVPFPVTSSELCGLVKERSAQKQEWSLIAVSWTSNQIIN